MQQGASRNHLPKRDLGERCECQQQAQRGRGNGASSGAPPHVVHVDVQVVDGPPPQAAVARGVDRIIWEAAAATAGPAAAAPPRRVGHRADRGVATLEVRKEAGDAHGCDGRSGARGRGAAAFQVPQRGRCCSGGAARVSSTARFGA